MIEGLLALYQTTFTSRWLTAARLMADTMVARFAAPDGGFYDTSDEHEKLIARPRNRYDNATPSGNAMAAMVLLRLGDLYPDAPYAAIAQETLISLGSNLAQQPLGHGQALQALAYGLAQRELIVIAGDSESDDARSLAAVAREGYAPFRSVVLGTPDVASLPPVLEGRTMLRGRATAYVCHGTRCLPPTDEPDMLRTLLRQSSREADDRSSAGPDTIRCCG